MQIYKKFLLFLMCISVATIAHAQVKKMVSYTSSTYNHPVVMDVYEYDYVDVQPEFPGGERELIKYINTERKYPEQAYMNNIQGRVLCSFVVNSDGSISHISILRGVEESLNKEAMRIVASMPKWTAGKINNTTVPVRCIIPIAFRR